MGKTLVIAEKPSVALSIAQVLNANEKKNGYYENDRYIVSWARGHLVGLSEPEKYDEKYKNWSVLPIIPQNWQYEIKVKDRFNILKELMEDTRVDNLVCATDAGREGELIFRHTYNKANCKKPFKRLWISSLEESAIQKGFDNLEEGWKYDDLYYAALCREQADWLVGINGTRLFSSLYSSANPLSIGRVQTPTLNLVVERDKSISSFKKERYFTVEIDCGEFIAESRQFKDINEAEKLLKNCADAIITDITEEEKATNPPKLYDLTTLQREANRLYGFTANQTLDSVQRLYDSKLSTYPRTDSRYLTEDMAETAKNILDIISEKFDFAKENNVEPNIMSILNNKKVSDHHAIIPTRKIKDADLSKLTDTDRKVLSLIASRLLSATAEKYIYVVTNVNLTCANEKFIAKGKTEIQKGFKEIEDNFKKVCKCEEEINEKQEKTIPKLEKNQTFKVSAQIAEHFTSPPKPYTEDTLLSAMERAGNADYETDEVERKGLGTPATRATIIETLITRGYIERRKKQIVSTEKGKTIVKVAPEKILSAKMTAEWENRLALIAKGEADKEKFMQDIKLFVNDFVENTKIVEEMKNTFNDREIIGKCPRCGNNVYEGKINFYCGNQDCEFALWKKNKFWESKKKELTKTIAKKLLQDGKVHIKDLFSEKSGKTYEADIILDDTGGKYVNFKMEFTSKR